MATAKTYTPPAEWKATGITLKRDGMSWSASWKLPGNSQDSNKWPDKCFTGVLVQWRLNIDNGKKKDPSTKDREMSGSASSGNVILSEFKTSKNKSYTRSMLFPYGKGKNDKTSIMGAGPKVDSLDVRVQGFHEVSNEVYESDVKDSNGKVIHKKGDHKYGNFHGKRFPGAWSSWGKLAIKPPKKPVVELSYAAGNVTAKITSFEDESGACEWARTIWTAKIKKTDGKEVTLKKWEATGLTEKEVVFDISKYTKALVQGKSVVVSVGARAQGLGGSTSSGWKTIKVGIPGPATITKISKVEKKTADTKIMVSLKHDSSGVAATNTETLQLQRRHGPSDTASWDDVDGAVDDNTCKALYDVIGDARPVAGEYIYYRVKSTGCGWNAYSAATRATCLFKKKPSITCNASCEIVSVESADNGESLWAVMAWTDKDATNTGSELSWSSDKDAWSSTDGPSTTTYVGADGTLHNKAKTKGYKKSKKVKITGLTPGETYSIRMRRYREINGEEGGETYYSAYSKRFDFIEESAEDDKCGIITDLIDADSTSAVIVVGISEDNVNTGTEVTWSDYKFAWKSNRAPSSIDATWGMDNPRKSSSWTKTQTVYLSDLEPGTMYWVKARRYLESSGGARTYSPYSNMPNFTTLAKNVAPVNMTCGLVSLTEGEDGKSAKAVIGYNGSRTGCEISWSDDPDAWESTSQPSTYEFENFDSKKQSADWTNTCTVYIHDLEEGTTYYAKARSYYDDPEGDRIWSDYSNRLDATPYSAPEEVVASAPDFVKRGDPIDVYWTVSGELEQKQWSIHPTSAPKTSLATGGGSVCHGVVTPERYGDASSIEMYVDASCGGGFTASKPVTVGIADVPLCEVHADSTLTSQPIEYTVYTDNPTASLLVTLYSNGVTWAHPSGERDQVEGDVIWTGPVIAAWTATTWGNTPIYTGLQDNVSAAEAAVEEASSAAGEIATLEAAVMAAEAALASAQSDLESAQEAAAALDEEDEGYDAAQAALENAEAAVESASASLENARDELAEAQETASGLVNAQSALSAAQEALAAHPSSGAVYEATLSLPSDLPLVDSASYTVSVRAVEPIGGLTSETAESKVEVAWAHQAPLPSSAITVTPNIDDRTATIALTEPVGAIEGDVYDVYRKTPTGYELIASGLPFECTVKDRYAPFGKDADLSYCVICRTVDGDEEFALYEYEMPVNVLRFDWENSSVELPWNLELSDSYEKSYEDRAHLDGSIAGYYEKSVFMNGTYSTDLNRAEGLEQLNSLRELGEHPGAVFCRTKLGAAFQCNAEVRSVQTGYASKTMPASIEVKAMDLTDLYRVADSDVEVES